MDKLHVLRNDFIISEMQEFPGVFSENILNIGVESGENRSASGQGELVVRYVLIYDEQITLTAEQFLFSGESHAALSADEIYHFRRRMGVLPHRLFAGIKSGKRKYRHRI